MAYIKNEPTEILYRYIVENIGIPTLSKQFGHNRNRIKEAFHGMGFNLERDEDVHGNKRYEGRDKGRYAGLLRGGKLKPDEIKELISNYINSHHRGVLPFDQYLLGCGIDPKTGARRQAAPAQQYQPQYQQAPPQYYQQAPPQYYQQAPPQYSQQGGQNAQPYAWPPAGQPNDSLDMRTKLFIVLMFVLMVAIFVGLSFLTSWAWWIKLLLSMVGTGIVLGVLTEKINGM